jgi:hypothetical protein
MAEPIEVDVGRGAVVLDGCPMHPLAALLLCRRLQDACGSAMSGVRVRMTDGFEGVIAYIDIGMVIVSGQVYKTEQIAEILYSESEVERAETR